MIRPASRLRFRLTTLFAVIVILSVVLAVGVQFPRVVLGSTYFLPCLLLSAMAGFATRSRLVFVAGLLGCYLGYVVHPRALVSWTAHATWWERQSFYWQISQPSMITGAIVMMVIAAVARIAVDRSRNETAKG